MDPPSVDMTSSRTVLCNDICLASSPPSVSVLLWKAAHLQRKATQLLLKGSAIVITQPLQAGNNFPLSPVSTFLRCIDTWPENKSLMFDILLGPKKKSSHKWTIRATEQPTWKVPLSTSKCGPPETPLRPQAF